MHGVFLDSGSLFPADLDLDPLTRALPDWRLHDRTAPIEVVDRLESASIVVVNKVRLDRATLANAPDLKLICAAATGTDNIDLAAARELGIAVANARGYATPSVAQHVFLLMFALLGRFTDYNGAVREGRWQKAGQFCLLAYPFTEAAGKILGIVGYGALGRRVAEIARVFGMRVMIAERPGATEADRMPLEQLLDQVDVLSLHCPLTDATRGLIGWPELTRMRAEAYLINTARGGIVDEQALADALRQGQIAGAAVDVLSSGPPSADHPLLATDIPNLIVTPHIAWGSRESRQRLVNDIADNITAFLAGEQRNRVV